MSSMFHDIQPAVKKETKRVAGITATGTLVMWIVFFVLHMGMPEKVPFDYTVILGGICGGLVAVLNFFLMGLTVQKVAAAEDEAAARMRMKASYSQRMLIQMLWVVILFSVCGRHSSAFIPRDRHQACRNHWKKKIVYFRKYEKK